ncbi:MAG: hypothetical protein BGO49_28980 [Planctomycetales bacterium 71-10]|nr:MAG: hypothetical protein BGO49_28980 [Planctomycetales bacterium 71-10]
MNEAKRKALEAAGWTVGDAEGFLGLTQEERGLVELRVALSRAVRAARACRGLTQAQAAQALKTSQPNVSRIEGAAPGVSLDLMFRSLFALGGTLRDVLPVE